MKQIDQGAKLYGYTALYATPQGIARQRGSRVLKFTESQQSATEKRTNRDNQ
jgi:hypothetical protein